MAGRWAPKRVAVGLSTFLTLLFCLVAPLAAQTAETTLEYWIWDNNQLPAVEQIVEAFEARYPNINVNVSVVPLGRLLGADPVSPSWLDRGPTSFG